MPQSWGKFFDQYPTSEAGIPVAMMRASARQPGVFPGPGGGGGAFPGPQGGGAFPQITPRMSTLTQPNIHPPMPPDPMLKGADLSNLKQEDTYGDMAKQIAGAVDPQAEGQKPDQFGNAMSQIDQQLAQMKADREAMVAAIAKQQQESANAPLQNGYMVPEGGSGDGRSPGGGPGSGASGNQGFNFNVGNLRTSGMNWAGKGTPYNGFETFDSPLSGAKAMYSNLKSYAGDPGMTMGKAIMKWAPPSENNTSAYISNVAKMAGLDPDTPLSQIVANPEMSAKMMAAMARIEKGSGLHPAFTHDLFVSAAGGDTGEKVPKYARGGRVRYLRSLVG